MKLLLFDIDGTLLLTDGAGTRAANRAFQKLHGIHNAMSSINAAGKTDPLILEEIFNNELGRSYLEHEAQEIFKEYISFFEDEIKTSRIRIMPGIPDLLEALSRRNDITMGLATGNIEHSAWIKLRHSGLDAHFKTGGYGSDSASREHLIRTGIKRAEKLLSEISEYEKIFVIGDTPYDINHGKAAGAITVAVATGSYSMDELRDHKPDYIFKDFTDLESVVEIFV